MAQEESVAAGPKPKVFIFTDANTDDVQAIKLLLKYSNVEVAALIPDCAASATWNLFGLLHFMDRDDIPIWAGQAYASAEIDSGDYGCRYAKTVPLFPKGKIWADTILGLNRRYPHPPENRNYYPNYTTVFTNLPQAVAATDGPVYFLSLGAFSTIDFLYRQNPWLVQRWIASSSWAALSSYTDPEAARAVFTSGTPITLVPLDATNAFQLSWDWLNSFGAIARTKEARFCHDLLALIKNNSASTSMYSLWDPLTAAILADPSLIVEQVTLNLTVAITGDQVVLEADPNFFSVFVNKLNQRPHFPHY
ncbi:Inosine-uridine preferring nucleoside hydrolase [Acanthamoeba castellanii str. Neff]|uniref:Inosine-uridine preferring nucleoside hydrolase n=1 Tax=Acanthamoeba castellanii (strain ATCC 30010 / Neff) TaxID=1257118 RepID=L8H1F8_ACACF|nr:Inosine-uridine preferring nucleoside hydrolase [Acanthamoeba castellanii str. Neff]ELR19344.1 Inosine-uridine preferring nucleoside hydrolase [Acanthamoeba castellanii str. Neff]